MNNSLSWISTGETTKIAGKTTRRRYEGIQCSQARTLSRKAGESDKTTFAFADCLLYRVSRTCLCTLLRLRQEKKVMLKTNGGRDKDLKAAAAWRLLMESRSIRRRDYPGESRDEKRGPYYSKLDEQEQKVRQRNTISWPEGKTRVGDDGRSRKRGGLVMERATKGLR
jgi:hypothetical protein